MQAMSARHKKYAKNQARETQSLCWPIEPTGRQSRPHCTPPEAALPLQLELTHRLDLHGIRDLRQDPRSDQDLPGPDFIAKPRGDIGDGADSGIIETILEADSDRRT
jgi:hypothetical protein